jgi:release factor H-coupled RctB family protein
MSVRYHPYFLRNLLSANKDRNPGCGIALYALSPLPSHPSPQKLASSLSQLDGPWEGDVKSFLAQSPYNITRESAFDKTSLGTVGGGNHFAEICCVERIVDESACESIGKEDGVNLSAKEFEDTLFLLGTLSRFSFSSILTLYLTVFQCLLVHTGSRGLGAQILESLTASKGTSNPYLAPSSDELNEYRTDHDYAVEWARANRDLLARRIYECLFPPTNAVPSESDEPAKKFPRKMIDITHNAVTPSTMTVGNEEKEIWIHRKGAAPTDQGIIPCPGSRGAFSWLLKPTGDGIQNGMGLFKFCPCL